MITTTKEAIKVLSYKSKKFNANNGQEVVFNEIIFCDDEGNKFSGTVPKFNTGDIDLVIDSQDKESVQGIADIQMSKASNKEGKAYVKLQVVKFKVLND